MSQSDVSRALQIDEICTRFEEELRGNHSPRIEAYLQNCAIAIKTQVLEELIALELWYARQRDIDPSIVDYLRRFPEHQAIVRECFTRDALPPSPAPVGLMNTADGSRTSSQETASPTKRKLEPSFALSEQFGRYRVLERLGEGGMGSVYLAKDQDLDRLIALKIPRLSRGDDSGVLNRFRREAQAAARIVHPNLCPVYDIGEIDGIFYLTMAYIEGQTLAHHIQQKRPINAHNSVALVRKIAHALAEAHAQNVIHRDLKPSNVMIKPGGEPVVVDFGLARTDVSEQASLTATGAIVGTPAYASPEQIDGSEPVDVRADIYSLGVILYELLTGKLPFHASSPVALLQQILTKTPAPPSTLRSQVPIELDAICLKAIAKQSDERYASMTEFDEALAEWESQTSLVVNSRPDWFRPTVIATPSQLGEPVRAKEKQNEVSVSRKPTPITQPASPLKSAQGWLKHHAKSISRFLMSMAVGLVLLTSGWLISRMDWEQQKQIPSESIVESPPLQGQMSSEGIDAGLEIDDVIDGGVPDFIVNPDFRAEFPKTVGGWTRLTGTLWRYDLPKMQTILFVIELRTVFSQVIDGHEYQDVEIEVTTRDLDSQTFDFHEQASLRIDVDHYRQDRKIKIREGHVLAGETHLEPKDRVHEQFDLEFDNVAQTYLYRQRELPPNRLSVQDVLAILFKANNAQTTHELYAGLHEILRNERFINKRRYNPDEQFVNGLKEKVYATEMKPGGEENAVEYTLALSDDVPFNWLMVHITDPRKEPFVTASMNRETVTGENAMRQLSPPEDGPTPPPPDVPVFAYLTLPKTQGAWARYDADLLIPDIPAPAPVELNRVEIKALEPEAVNIDGVDVPHRWIEVETQIGDDQDPRKIVETARLLIDEKSYEDRHQFKLARGYVRCKFRNSKGELKEFLAKFDSEEDRLDRLFQGELPENRFPIGNVLALVFGAKVTSEKMNFDARKRISHALMDDNLKRLFDDRLDPYRIDGKPPIKCIEVRPVSAVPIPPGRGLALPATSLNYVIKVSHDCPWGWLFIDLSLSKENSPLKLFAGKLTLRDFGENQTTSFSNDETEIRKSDPEEKVAQGKYDLALKLEKLGKSARQQYETIVEKHPDTLASQLAKGKLK